MGEWRIEELPETLKPDDLVELEHLHLAHDEIHGFRVYMVREEAHRLLHLLNHRDHELARLAEEMNEYHTDRKSKGRNVLERERWLSGWYQRFDAIKAQATGGQ